MSSVWPSALGSLDDSLALPFDTVGKLKAAQTVDIDAVVQQLHAAAESGVRLRALISAELPDASWQSRAELHAVIAEIQKLEEARRIEQLRSRLLALATELEGGKIVHRRAARVTELNQLREQAIKELLSQGAIEGTPPILPGPEPDQWVEWACGLQEPEDTESLEILRQRFPQLDDFVTNLEPDMWQPETPPQASVESAEDAEERRKALEQRRSRLLALATELERGSVVHHRVLRVNELNYLRDQAIKELRSQAKLPSGPKPLPGPEADQWIEWACGLREPQDAEALQTLRKAFSRLDDFIANLEPNMWKPAGLPPRTPPDGGRPADKPRQEPPAPATKGVAEYAVAAPPIPINVAGKSSGGRDKAQVQVARAESAVSALEPETVVVPSNGTPSRSDEEIQRMQAREREALARIKSAIPETVRTFDHRIPRSASGKGNRAVAPAIQKDRVEPKASPEAPRATAAAAAVVVEPIKAAIPAEAIKKTVMVRAVPDDKPAVAAKAPQAVSATQTEASGTWAEFVSDFKDGGVGALLQDRWRLPVVGVALLVLVLLVLGTVYWVHRSHAGNNAVKAAETSVVTPSNAASTAQPAISTDSAATTAAGKTQADKPKTKDQPKDQSATGKPPEPAPSQAVTQAPALDASLRLPAPVPKAAPPVANKEIAKEEPPAPNGAMGVAGSVPGGLPGGAPSSVINVVKDLSAAEPKPGTQKVTVSSGVAQGLLVHRVAPQYPAQAKQARLQGTVVLQAVIGKDGNVTSVKALKGNPVLTQAAIDAVKQWRYRPYALNGEPVEADTQISVTFTPQQ
jgi:protein TonB